jgi:hydrogenase expression/formation protein HypE
LNDPAMNDRVLLAQGNGGRLMRELIEDVFLRTLGEAAPESLSDAAALPAASSTLMVTTDGFTVEPLEFPGGDLGSLAVHGSVNDLAVAGAVPKWLTLAAIIEEGLEIACLRRLVASFGRAARKIGARVTAGDTKVVPHGRGGGAYLAVTGIGERTRAGLDLSRIEVGDAVLVSGPVGDHGIAVMLARQEFDLHGNVLSDSAPVLDLCSALWPLAGLRFMRDPTRGGLATVANEISQATRLGLRLNEEAIPVRPTTASVCEMLGYDPLTLACEGRVVAVVAADQADEALQRWRELETGRGAAIIGRAESGAARVILETAPGGERVLDELVDDPLPRIC